jgi:hypothetical protein
LRCGLSSYRFAAHDENFATGQEYGNSLCRADWYVIQNIVLCSLCLGKVTQQARANLTNRVAVIEDPFAGKARRNNQSLRWGEA